MRDLTWSPFGNRDVMSTPYEAALPTGSLEGTSVNVIFTVHVSCRSIGGGEGDRFLFPRRR